MPFSPSHWRWRLHTEGVREFALSHAGSSDPELTKLVRRFERAIALTYLVPMNGGKQLIQLGRRLDTIISWAEAKGVVWPPQAPLRQLEADEETLGESEKQRS
jgi:hypothetical protein